MDDEILNAILKRALGYSYKEVQEEYDKTQDNRQISPARQRGSEDLS